MRALLFDEARQDARTLRVLHAAVTEQLEAAGYEPTRCVLHETPIQPGNGNFCPLKTHRHLYPQDAGREVTEQLVAATSHVIHARPSCRHSASSTASIAGVRFDTYPRLLALD